MTQQNGYPDNRSNGYPDDRGGNSYPGDRGGSYPSDSRGAPQQSQRQDDDDNGLVEGEWPCRAVADRFGEAGNGTIQIGVRVRFTDGPNAGRTGLWYGSFTDKSEEITLRGMRALGFRGGNDIFDTRGFYDPEVQKIVSPVAVVERELNPKTQKIVAKVKFINGADVMMAKDMTESDRKRFAQRMAGVLARTGGGGGSPPRDDRGGGGQGWNAPPQDNRRGNGRPDDRGAPPPSDQDAPPWQGRGGGGGGGNGRW